MVGPPESEISALYAIYNATLGMGWSWTGVPWNFSQPQPDPCADQWQGIYCSTTCNTTTCTESITSMLLQSLGMAGTLPLEIGNLTSLANLTIANNDGLTGGIPATIGNLTSLLQLHLRRNALSGTIPSSLGGLPLLQVLDLSDNSLDSYVPSDLGNLSRLTAMNLSYNYLSGPVPQAWMGLTKLRELMLINNYLNGPLPDIGRLHNLVLVDLATNDFVGSIPSSIGGLSKLQFLSLSRNQLTGTIPQAIGNLTALKALTMFTNELKGAIPKEISLLSNLTIFSVTSNKLTGSIPDEIGALPNITQIGVGENLLTGAIPFSVWKSTTLHAFVALNNHLNGSLPADIGDYNSSLQILILEMNLLTGDIPASIAGMKSLSKLILGQNLFIGGIPDALANMLLLEDLYLNGNLLSGTIPENFGNGSLTSLALLELQHNLLFGAIPDSMAGLSALSSFSLAQNLFAGSISAVMDTWSNLAQLALQDNQFTGSFPFSLSACSELYILELQSNYLSGDLSFLPAPQANSLRYVNISSNLFHGNASAVAGLNTLVVLDLSVNMLSGPVDAPSNISSLQSLFLQDNMFTGSIERIFDEQHDLNMVYIDLSKNRLSGRLPNSIAPGSYLSMFAAIQNCFTGTIPAGLCNAIFMQVLALDGLSTAPSCRVPILNGIAGVNTYVLRTKAMHGSIPSCLFSMPFLNTLHISGNNLDGSIAIMDEAAFLENTLMDDLSLSHNRLTGTIPTALQQVKQWSGFDLGFNKFVGELYDGEEWYRTDAEVILDINRLSGRIPGFYYAFSDVNMLQGNMFQCDGDGLHNNVPSSDPYHSQYDCGSGTADMAFYTWMSLVIFSVLVIVILACLRIRWKQTKSSEDTGAWHRFMQHVDAVVEGLSTWRAIYRGERSISFHYGADGVDKEVALESGASASVDSRRSARSSVSEAILQHIYKAGRLFHEMRVFSCRVTMFLAVVATPVYVSLTFYNGSYEQQYAWTNSAAYLSGQDAALVLFALFSAALVVFDCLRAKIMSKMTTLFEESNSDGISGGMSSDPTPAYLMHLLSSLQAPSTIITILIIAVNITVVMLVNGFFVYLYLQLSKTAALFLAVALAVFKLMWGFVLQTCIVRLLQSNTGKGDANIITMGNVWLYSSMMMFNTIVAPCLAALFASSSCFYYVFATPPNITSNYRFMTCSSFYSLGCQDYEIAEHSFEYQPPFLYSYQCASALLVDYAYVFAYKYIIVGVLYPMVVIAVSFWLNHSIQQSTCRTLCTAMLPPIWRTGLPTQGMPAFASNGFVFSAGDYAVRMAMMISTLLTFGTVLPYLAILICFAICSNTYLTQLGLARLLETSATEDAQRDMVELVCLQCAKLFHAMRLAVKPLPVLMTVFYGCFLFDTEGDREGAEKGFYFLLALMVLGLLLYAARVLLARWEPANKADEGIELVRTTISTLHAPEPQPQPQGSDEKASVHT